MPPPHKKQKHYKEIIDSQHQQCSQIIQTLDTIINNQTLSIKIPFIILQEIAQYCIGYIIHCYNTQCIGIIHVLNSDNFNVPSPRSIYCNRYSAWNLFNYKCSEDKCNYISNVFMCSDTNCNVIKIFDPEEGPFCHGSICSNGVLLKPLCNKIYCKQHEKKNGTTCTICSIYYCLNCKPENYGASCRKCNKYYCDDHINLNEACICTSCSN